MAREHWGRLLAVCILLIAGTGFGAHAHRGLAHHDLAEVETEHDGHSDSDHPAPGGPVDDDCPACVAIASAKVMTLPPAPVAVALTEPRVERVRAARVRRGAARALSTVQARGPPAA